MRRLAEDVHFSFSMQDNVGVTLIRLELRGLLDDRLVHYISDQLNVGHTFPSNVASRLPPRLPIELPRGHIYEQLTCLSEFRVDKLTSLSFIARGLVHCSVGVNPLLICGVLLEPLRPIFSGDINVRLWRYRGAGSLARCGLISEVESH